MHIDVEKIAKLAYLELSQQEKSRFQTQFDQILDYVAQLEKVPMTEAEAQSMGSFHVLTAFYEELKISSQLSLRNENEGKEINQVVTTNEEAVASAPKTGGLPGQLLYEVPSIIER